MIEEKKVKYRGGEPGKESRISRKKKGGKKHIEEEKKVRYLGGERRQK